MDAFPDPEMRAAAGVHPLKHCISRLYRLHTQYSMYCSSEQFQNANRVMDRGWRGKNFVHCSLYGTKRVAATPSTAIRRPPPRLQAPGPDRLKSSKPRWPAPGCGLRRAGGGFSFVISRSIPSVNTAKSFCSPRPRKFGFGLCEIVGTFAKLAPQNLETALLLLACRLASRFSPR